MALPSNPYKQRSHTNLGSGTRQPTQSTTEPKSPLVSRPEYPLTHRVADQQVVARMHSSDAGEEIQK